MVIVNRFEPIEPLSIYLRVDVMYRAKVVFDVGSPLFEISWALHLPGRDIYVVLLLLEDKPISLTKDCLCLPYSDHSKALYLLKESLFMWYFLVNRVYCYVYIERFAYFDST